MWLLGHCYVVARVLLYGSLGVAVWLLECCYMVAWVF